MLAGKRHTTFDYEVGDSKLACAKCPRLPNRVEVLTGNVLSFVNYAQPHNIYVGSKNMAFQNCNFALGSSLISMPAKNNRNNGKFMLH